MKTEDLAELGYETPVTTPFGPGYLIGAERSTKEMSTVVWALVQYRRAQFAKEEWVSLFSEPVIREEFDVDEKGKQITRQVVGKGGPCVFWWVALDQIDVAEKPHKAISTPRSVSTRVTDIEIAAGETWQSRKGGREHFKVVSVIGEVVNLLGIESVGYARETSKHSMSRFYDKVDGEVLSE